MFFSLRTLFFAASSRRNMRKEASKLRRQAKSLDLQSHFQIGRLLARYEPQISQEDFTLLCVATATTLGVPLATLEEEVMLTEYLDSVKYVDFAVLLETLFSIETNEWELDDLDTFEEVLGFVVSKLNSN